MKIIPPMVVFLLAIRRAINIIKLGMRCIKRPIPKGVSKEKRVKKMRIIMARMVAVSFMGLLFNK